MTPILAQSTDLPSVPDSTFKWVMIILVSVVLIAAVAYAAFRKQEPLKISDDPAVEVRKAAKRYNHDATSERFFRIEGRLDGHDAEMDELWTTMRAEDQRMRENNAERFEEIARSLCRIEGKLGTTPR